MSRGKVLYFQAGEQPTTPEAAAIARLMAAGYDVGVRNGAVDTTYSTHLETSDYVAGTIPSAYNSVASADHVAEGAFALVLLPASGAISGTGTKNLQALAVDQNGGVTDVTTSCTYVSSVPAKATVVGGTGVVTGVAAGTTTITATYTYATGKTMTATKVITVT